MSTRARVGCRRAFGALAVLGLLAGCGSTAVAPPGSAGAAAAGLGADGGVPGATAAAGGAGIASGTPAAGSVAGSGGGARALPGSGPGAAGTPGATGSLAGSGGAGPSGSLGGIPVKGQGWDAHNVYLGIITESDASNALHTMGVSLDPGDEIGDATAIVADLNRRGGLFGRHVVLVDKDDKSANVLADASAAGQADCTYFSQDHPVISVVNTDALLDIDAFRGCFAKARIPLTSLTTSAFDDRAAAELAPYFYNALSVSWSRLHQLLVQRLRGLQYFAGWNTATGSASPAAAVKVGVLYGNDAASTREGPALLADLKKAGYPTAYYQYSSDGDAQSAVFQFEAAHVTHVIGLDSFQFFFMTAANSQHYLPRFGVTTYNGPQALLQSNGNAAQLAGAVGVGWYPSFDTDDAHDPGPGPGKRACLAALSAGGQSFAGRRFALATGLAICDGLHLAVFGAQRAGGLDPGTIRQGIVALGGGFPTAGGFASGLSGTNFAMPGAGRDLLWDTSCTCFHYTGATYRIG